jgi:hypothetical protein
VCVCARVRVCVWERARAYVCGVCVCGGGGGVFFLLGHVASHEKLQHESIPVESNDFRRWCTTLSDTASRLVVSQGPKVSPSSHQKTETDPVSEMLCFPDDVQSP